jgi:hypothetical protein
VAIQVVDKMVFWADTLSAISEQNYERWA